MTGLRMKKILRGWCAVMIVLSLCLAGCAGKAEGELTGSEGDGAAAEGEESFAENSAQEEEQSEKMIWLCCEELDFAMKIPRDLSQGTDAVHWSAGAGGEDRGKEGARHMVFRGENDSLGVELALWDQVSEPDLASLSRVASEVTLQETEVLERNGVRLVKVLWPHGEVNYYLMAQNGDAYYLWIDPYVMKDPGVYEKVRTMEESFCRPGDIPAGQEILMVSGPAWEEINYLLLVNAKNPLPEDWEEALDLVCMVNSVGDRVWVERTAYKAYLELKADLLTNEGIDIDLDSAYRSVAYQQEILERFTEKYGAAYAERTVAKPGYSEHHTGLALDLYFHLDGALVYENEDLVQYPEVWKKIHERLAEHGFILRYPGGENSTVDYAYEPWHIRYVGEETAKILMSASPILTLEEWLGE